MYIKIIYILYYILRFWLNIGQISYASWDPSDGSEYLISKYLNLYQIMFFMLDPVSSVNPIWF